MKRLKFILSFAATLATPLFVFGGRQDEVKPKKRSKGFLIKANESRFNEKLISGKNQTSGSKPYFNPSHPPLIPALVANLQRSAETDQYLNLVVICIL